ncbi:MAG TPA: DMT family transporter [Streptosporangiaceae bacterium]
MRRCLLGLIVASALWGGAVSGTKFALGGFAPVTLLATELAAAAAVLWLGLLARGYRSPRVWWLPVVLGLLEPALAYLCETLGLSMTSAVHGALLSGLESALVVVLAALVLRETITVTAALAVLVAVGGLIVLAGPGASHGTAPGDLLVAGGVLSASLYTIVAKRFDDGSDPLALTTWQFTVAALAVAGAATARWASGAEPLPAAVAPRFWLAAMLVGVAGYGASFLVFNSVISRVGATQAAIVLNLIPVFAFVGATVFLGEGVTSADVIGAALVGASVVYFTVADHYASAVEDLAL